MESYIFALLLLLVQANSPILSVEKDNTMLILIFIIISVIIFMFCILPAFIYLCCVCCEREENHLLN